MERFILDNISVEYFRTIKKLEVKLYSKISILIGANETGKTNILDCIALLSPKNEFKSGDVTIGSDRERNKKNPSIEYNFLIPNGIKNKICKFYPQFNTEMYFTITRENDSLAYNIPKEDEKKIIVNASQEKLDISYEGEKISISADDYICYPNNLNEAKKEKLDRVIYETGKAKILEGEESKRYLFDTFSQIIDENIPDVYNWKYEEKDDIPSNVPIQELIANPESHRTVINLFRLASYGNVTDIFQGRDDIYIMNRLEEISKKISRLIEKSWRQLRNINIILRKTGDNLAITIKEKRTIIEPGRRSEGLKWFLSFLINFRAELGVELKNKIILLDEPGIKLHPGGQKDLIREFEALGKENQLIYTTHSPFMINKNHHDRVIVLGRKGDHTSIITKPLHKRFLDNEVLRNSIGFNFSDSWLVADKNIIVEGLTDKIIISSVSNFFAKHDLEFINFEDISLMAAFAASKIAPLAEILKSNGLTCVTLYDADHEGDEAIKKAKEDKILSNNEIISLRDIDDNLVTSLDLIPNSILDESLKVFLTRINIDVVTLTFLDNNTDKEKKIDKIFKDKGIEYKRKNKTEFYYTIAEILSERSTPILKGKKLEAGYKNIEKLLKEINKRFYKLRRKK